MTTRRTTTTYAILGLLGVRTWTTYELAKQVQRSLHWFWPRAERKLYDEPKRLVADGLATATKEATGKRPRTVYGITDAGREELGRWLGEPPVPPSIEFEGLVKVFFAEAGSLDQLHANLDAIADEATARLDGLAVTADGGVETSDFPQRLHIGALPIRLSFELECDRCAGWSGHAQQVAEWKDAGDPGRWHAGRALAEMAADARTAVREPTRRTGDSPVCAHRWRPAPTFADMAKKAKLATTMRGWAWRCSVPSAVWRAPSAASGCCRTTCGGGRGLRDRPA